MNFIIDGILPKSILYNKIFDQINKNLQKFNKASFNIDKQNQEICQIYNGFIESNKKFIGSLDKMFNEEDNYLKRFFTNFTIFSNNLQKMFELNINTFKSISLNVIPLIESISTETVNPCKNKYQNYKKYQNRIQNTFKQYLNQIKSFRDGAKNYKNSFDDPKYAFNTSEKAKRYKICQNYYKSIIKSQNNLQNQINIINQCKSQFIKQLNYFLSYIKNAFNMIQNIFKSQCHILSQCFCKTLKKVLYQIGEYLGIFKSFSLQNYLQNVNYSQQLSKFFNNKIIDNLEQNDLINFNKFLANYQEYLTQKINKNKILFNKIVILINQYKKIIIKFKQLLTKQLKQFSQDMKKKYVQIFGKDITSLYLYYIKIHQNVVENIDIFINKSNLISQSINIQITSSGKNIQLLLKELNKIITDHGNLRKQYLKKKNLNPSSLEISNINKQSNNKTINQEMLKSIKEKNKLIQFFLQDLKQKQNKILKRIKVKIQQIIVTFLSLLQNIFAYGNQNQQLINQKKNQSTQQLINIFIKDNLIQNLQLLQTKIEQKISLNFNNYFDHQQFNLLIKFQDENQKDIQQQQQIDNEQQKKIQNISKINEDNLKKIKLFLLEKTTLQQNQIIINNYSCAFLDKILLQGRLYITTRKLFFYSSFNASILFLGQSKIEVKKHEIIKLQKRKNGLFFDNSIAIITKKGQLFFTTFIKRDQTFDIISKTFNLFKKQKVLQNKKNEKNIHLRKYLFNQSQDKNKQRKQNIQNIIKNYFQNTQLILSYKIQNVSLIQFFYKTIIRSEIQILGKEYDSFYQYMRMINKDINIDIQEWKPQIKIDNIYGNVAEYKREINFTHLIPTVGIPFLPKTCQANSKQFLFLYDNSKYYFYQQIFMSGAPYSDTFIVRLYNQIIQSNLKGQLFQLDIQINIYLQIKMIKSTILKNKIHGKAWQETVSSQKLQQQHLKLLFCNKEANNENNKKANDEKNQKNIVENRQQKEKLLKENKNLRRQNLIYRGLLICLLIKFIINLFI